ncbi:MAG: HEPN-associated N-terminal domain-containing protein [Actinomycetota bacterium]|nr:HEPN-associated N-terminal domain-containing protein [Actinomycetota bacterium]
MGFAKQWQLEQQERGWYSRNGFVCQQCVYDPALVALIEANVVETSCDFCGATGVAPIAAEIDVVLEAVADGLYFEYEDPVNQVAYDSAEGGYQMALSSTFDLAMEHEVSENEKVLDAIAFSIDHEWVQRDPYAPNPHQALTWGWDEFRSHVMHTRRFTFLLPSEDGERSRGHGEIPPEDMLGALADAIVNANLATTIPAGTQYWRARPHAEAVFFTTAKDLGSPPPAAARTNRMTPAGISAFYGASTRKVAIDEVRGYSDPDSVLTVARFQTSHAMTVIDLVALPSVPSLFDATNRHRRAAVQFLRDFAVDVAQISNPDDREHLDYVPTQIASEYLRHYYPDARVRGLRWRSTKNADETSTVLFLDNDACVDAVGGWQSGPRDRLGMDASSVERIAPSG